MDARAPRPEGAPGATPGAGAATLSATGGPAASAAGQLCWALFEWGRNPHVLLVTIYIFAPYFTATVVGDPVRGQAVWGYVNGIGGFGIALLGPVLGAIADTGGRRKPWIAAFVAVMAPASALLWFALPAGAGLGVAAIAALIVTNAIAFEFSAVFHNAMLPSIAPRARIGFLSGLGLALGNAGGLLIFVFVLWAFMLPGAVDWSFVPAAPLFGIDRAAHEHERLAGPIAAVWMALFSLPLLLVTPDVPRGGLPPLAAIRRGVAALLATLRRLGQFRNIALYLLARMLYNDGKTAVLVFGGVYAAGVFGWDALTMTVYAIVLSIFAVVGGILGGWLDDTFGSRNAILVSIGGTSLGLLGALSVTPDALLFAIPWDRAAPPLWDLPLFRTVPEVVYLAIVISVAIFITAAYANSRTMLARLAPPQMMNEFFGLYALSGTATSFLAPLCVGFFTDLLGQRAGFASILIFLVAGLAAMLLVREERAAALH
jgi:UMF1 family MFS transporter